MALRESSRGAAPDAGDFDVEVAGLSKVYDLARGGRVVALEGIDLKVNRGEFVSLLGPSGCGKSTLLQVMAGLTTATSGAVMIEGRKVLRPQSQVGLVFQSPVLLEWRTALKNVLLQAEARGLERTKATADAMRLLAQVGLNGFEDKRPYELSGGMQQRVSICRALLHDPRLVLMDEPFGALDAITRDQMAVDLQGLWTTGAKTVVFVTHSVEEAAFLSDRVLVMSARPGRIIAEVEVELPRPRRLRMRSTPEFLRYTAEIRDALAATGVIRESDE
jgi:NitT/TauT family transport system ATP-binding protein